MAILMTNGCLKLISTNAQHRIGNSGADSCKLNICNSIEHLCKCWADVFQMPHHRQYVAVTCYVRTTVHHDTLWRTDNLTLRTTGKLKTDQSKQKIKNKIMALFLITVKQNKYSNGIKLEKGMSVEVSSSYSNPLTTNGGHEVQDAFMRKYGLDLKKNGGNSSVYLDVKKMN